MAEKFADKLQKIEDGVVVTYKKIENGVTDAYQKVEDKFIDTFVAKGGETVAAAKERMLKNQETLDAKMKAEAEKRTQAQKEMIEKSIQAGKNAGMANLAKNMKTGVDNYKVDGKICCNCRGKRSDC